MPTVPADEEIWRRYLAGEFHHKVMMRHLFRLVPHDPRCRWCFAPFKGLGGLLVRRFMGLRPSNKNPKMCNACDDFARDHPGGAEVDMSFLFADVRGSTNLAERMTPAEFSKLMNRFYAAANEVLVHYDAWVDKMIGDEVVGFYLPGFAGPDYAAKAIHTASALLEATGHGSRKGPWIPVGVGVHTGRAYMGTVGSADTVMDLTALGDAVNVAARLASAAGAGEILISEASGVAAGMDLSDLERRELDLKGKSEKVAVRVRMMKNER